MPPGTLQKQDRKLSAKINDEDAYLRELVNDDLDEYDEITDEIAELELIRSRLDDEIAASDDADQRKELRLDLRAHTRQQRQLTVRLLGVFVEDKSGERFADDALAKIPLRVQSVLLDEATKRVFGQAEGPTPGTSASA
jgi:hypothetical protein